MVVSRKDAKPQRRKELNLFKSICMNDPALTLPENMSPEEYKKFIEEYNQELEEAEAEYQRGECISHEEMKRQIKDWFNEVSKDGDTLSGR
jgi:hypothetical protein